MVINKRTGLPPTPSQEQVDTITEGLRQAIRYAQGYAKTPALCGEIITDRQAFNEAIREGRIVFPDYEQLCDNKTGWLICISEELGDELLRAVDEGVFAIPLESEVGDTLLPAYEVPIPEMGGICQVTLFGQQFDVTHPIAITLLLYTSPDRLKAAATIPIPYDGGSRYWSILDRKVSIQPSHRPGYLYVIPENTTNEESSDDQE